MCNKRKAIEEDDTGFESDASSPQLPLNNGRWTYAEIEKFKIGVNAHGWGDKTPKQISIYETRIAKRMRQNE
jgi:hypothetical protein